MELELKVSHHRDLLQGNPTQYNRVAASVIQDLLGPEYDIMKMTTAEMYYYFFMAKANTLGPIWKFPWECAHTLMKDGLETKCGHKNIAAYDLSKMKPTPMAAGYVAPKRKLRLTTVGKINTAGPSSFPGEFYRQSIDVNAHTAKLGLNYRWGGPVIARY